MLEIITFLYVFFNKYRSIKEVQPTSQRTMDLVHRRIDIQQEKDLGEENQNVAKVSWYDRSACGSRIYGKTCKTANGEVFSESELTFANKSMQFGTRIRFCYGNNCVVCRLNDRGPYIAGREFDFSRGCFSQLADVSKGVLMVTWEKI